LHNLSTKENKMEAQPTRPTGEEERKVIVNGYIETICPLSMRGCEWAKNKEIFERNCNREYKKCLFYQINQGLGAGFYEPDGRK